MAACCFGGKHAALGIVLIASLGCAGVMNRVTGEGDAERIRQIGVAAEARIIEIADSGITVNNDPVIDFVLEVRPAEGEPFRATARSRISRIRVPQYQPGASVRVRYDPNDRTRAALDFTR